MKKYLGKILEKCIIHSHSLIKATWSVIDNYLKMMEINAWQTTKTKKSDAWSPFKIKFAMQNLSLFIFVKYSEFFALISLLYNLLEAVRNRVTGGCWSIASCKSDVLATTYH